MMDFCGYLHFLPDLLKWQFEQDDDLNIDLKDVNPASNRIIDRMTASIIVI